MIKADNTQKRCFIACDEQTRKNGRCSCLTSTHQAEQLLENAVMQSVILPNELSIGNLFYRTNKHTKERLKIELTASCIMDIIHNGENSSFIYEPIKISERRLLKFGFKQDAKGYFWLNISSNENVESYIYINPFGSGIGIHQEFKEFSLEAELKYVHQVQNLYFSLTRVSLTVL